MDLYEADREYDDYMRERDDRNSTNSVVEFFVMGAVVVAIVGALLYGAASWIDQQFGTDLATGLQEWFKGILEQPQP